MSERITEGRGMLPASTGARETVEDQTVNLLTGSLNVNLEKTVEIRTAGMNTGRARAVGELNSQHSTHRRDRGMWPRG